MNESPTRGRTHGPFDRHPGSCTAQGDLDGGIEPVDLAQTGWPIGFWWAELIAQWTGSTRVAKAFNTTGSANMADPTYPAGTPIMPVAGDDIDAKAIVITLAAELGFDPIDTGGLSTSSDLEHLAMLWIRLAYPLGQGPGIAFSLLRR